jgi:hypothetical protein
MTVRVIWGRFQRAAISFLRVTNGTGPGCGWGTGFPGPLLMLAGCR